MRFISHNSALQKVVRALLTSIGGFISVAFILFMIWFVFGIVGVSLFAGKLQYCDYDKYNMETKEMVIVIYIYIYSVKNQEGTGRRIIVILTM